MDLRNIRVRSGIVGALVGQALEVGQEAVISRSRHPHGSRTSTGTSAAAATRNAGGAADRELVTSALDIVSLEDTIRPSRAGRIARGRSMTTRDLLPDDPVPEAAAGPARFVAAVITTYNCYTSIERTILAIANQVAKVIIVDNGSEPETLDAIKGAIERNRLQTCELLPQGRNLGIGAAINIGVRAALAGGAAYILTLDDDTEVSPGTVAELVRCFIDHEAQHVGIVWAQWIVESNFAQTSYGESDTPRTVDRTPSSGCMIRREVFESVGMFREDYFLDFTNYEYCARIINAGWRVLACPTATVFQRPGDVTRRQFFGRTVVVSNYPAERLYFLCRNGFVLYLWERRSGRHLREHCRSTASRFVKSLLYEREKTRKSSAIIRGSVEGLLGRLGPPSTRDGDHRIRRLDRTEDSHIPTLRWFKL